MIYVFVNSFFCHLRPIRPLFPVERTASMTFRSSVRQVESCRLSNWWEIEADRPEQIWVRMSNHVKTKITFYYFWITKVPLHATKTKSFRGEIQRNRKVDAPDFEVVSQIICFGGRWARQSGWVNNTKPSGVLWFPRFQCWKEIDGLIALFH